MTDAEPVWAGGSFLSLIGAEEREELLAKGTTRRLPPGRQMLVEGRLDAHVEVIRQGYVKVSTSVGGMPQLLAIRLPGDLVGELAAFTGSGRCATVTTYGEVVSTVIQRPDFMSF